MELKGEYRIPASRERVWALLNDPDVLRACIPGCETLEKTGEDSFAARVTTRLGPVKATFAGEVTITGRNPPESYRISGEGKGGAAGFARGGADVRLAEDGDGTVLTYAADAMVGGKLAQLGGRLIDSTAKKLADQFFACFAEKAAGAGARAPGDAASLDRDVPVPPGRADRGPGEAGESVVPSGGILSERAGEPLVGAAAHVTTGVDPDRLEIEEALHLRDDAEDSVPPRASVPGTMTDTTTPELGQARLGESHRPNALEQAEAGLEREAARGALGGPMVWGLLALAALIVVWFIAT